MTTILPPLPRPTQCGARTRDGDSCRRAPVVGTNRCSLHGGALPQVRQRVAETMAAAALPAAQVLLDIVDRWQADRCEVCGQPKGDPSAVIRAATAVLDRTGFGKTQSLDVHHHVGPTSGPDVATLVQWMPDWQLAQLDAWWKEAEERMLRGESQAPITLRLVEGTVVSDDAPPAATPKSTPEGCAPEADAPKDG